MYKLIKNEITGVIGIVLRLSDNAYIPFDLANTDYQAYLAWIEAGNEPTPADSE